jgi:hypothetical protein
MRYVRLMLALPLLPTLIALSLQLRLVERIARRQTPL